MHYDLTNLQVVDLQYFFYGLERLALILLLVILTKISIEKAGWHTPKLKRLIIILVATLCISLAAQYATSLHSYIDRVRPLYEKSRSGETGI